MVAVIAGLTRNLRARSQRPETRGQIKPRP